MVRISIAAVILASLGGCVPSEVIVLKNPANGEIKECSKNSGSSLFPIAQPMLDNSAARSCAAGYQTAGFVRMN
jgi:hypothetical protein